MQSPQQVFTLAGIELADVRLDAELVFIATLATENQRADSLLERRRNNGLLSLSHKKHLRNGTAPGSPFSENSC